MGGTPSPPRANTMHNHHASAANIRATSMGGIRTGLSGMRNTQPGPVTIIYAGGSNLPCPTKVTHPEPSVVDPTAAKVAAVLATIKPRKARKPAATKAKSTRHGVVLGTPTARCLYHVVADFGGYVKVRAHTPAQAKAIAERDAKITPVAVMRQSTAKA